MYTPKQFAKKAGLSYEQVLKMCKEDKEIHPIITEGGHFKIPESQLEKYNNNDFVPMEKYLKLENENEKLKSLIENIKNVVAAITA